MLKVLQEVLIGFMVLSTTISLYSGSRMLVEKLGLIGGGLMFILILGMCYGVGRTIL